MLCIQIAKRKEKAITFKIQEEEKEFKKRISKDEKLSKDEKKILKNSFKTPVPDTGDASAVFLNYITEIITWIHDMLLRKTNQRVLVEEEEALLEKALKPIPSRKNPYVSNWERKFHKDLRSNAVKKVCESYKTAIGNFKAGNIKSFDIKYMASKEPRKCIELTSGQLGIKNKNIHIPSFKGCPTLKVSKKMAKKLNGIQIKNNCDFVCQKNSYWIFIPVEIKIPKLDVEKPRYCGVDPGIVKIATTFGNNGITEYTHNRELLKRYNLKLIFLKTKRTIGRVRKKQLNKIEKKKIDYTNQLHWKLIKSLLDENDVVFFGDIKSHDIVKNGNNSFNNQEFNDLKFYRLKQRLIYKSKTRCKKVILVNEMYTSKTCSICGNLEEMKDRIYYCKCCKTTVDRDINPAKNILMRGILCM
jgi:putative transposase